MICARSNPKHIYNFILKQQELSWTWRVVNEINEFKNDSKKAKFKLLKSEDFYFPACEIFLQ